MAVNQKMICYLQKLNEYLGLNSVMIDYFDLANSNYLVKNEMHANVRQLEHPYQ